MHMVVFRERSTSFSLVAECLGLAWVLCLAEPQPCHPLGGSTICGKRRLEGCVL